MTPTSSSILAFAEQQDGVLTRNAREVLAVASGWPASSPARLAAVTLGVRSEQAAIEIAARGVGLVRWMADAEPLYAPMRWLRAVGCVAEEFGAGVVLFPDSCVGRDLAPRLAVRLGGLFLAGALAVRRVEGRLRVTKPLFGGRFVEEVELREGRRLVLTWCGIAPSTTRERTGASGEVRRIQLGADPLDARVRIAAGPAAAGQDLSQAEVIVCGGRGVGSKEGFQLVRDLAAAMGGVPAASRAAVDAGYAPPELQVGQSGKTVSPALYMALGVSGSLQHQAGMRNSRCVVAINTDPAAPIMRWADYAIVGDLRDMARALQETLRAG